MLKQLTQVSIYIHADVHGPGLKKLEHVKFSGVEHDTLKRLCRFVSVHVQLLYAFLADLAQLLPEALLSLFFNHLPQVFFLVLA